MATGNRQKEEGEKENISIKGIQKNVYDKVKNLARETGKTVGDLTNDAFKVVLSAANETKKVGGEFVKGMKESMVSSVQDISSLEISGNELIMNNRRVSFRNIDHLVFKDITEKDFADFVDSIVNVKTLEVPKTLSKFLVLERSKFIENLKFY
jgi:hypothetical protein